LSPIATVSFALLAVAAVAGLVFIAKGVVDMCSREILRGISYVAVGGFVSYFTIFCGLFVLATPSRSPRAKCMSNLSQIGKALKMYSMDGETFPPTFRELGTNYVGSFRIFVCPSSGNRPGSPSNVCDWTDYTYVSGLGEADPSACAFAFCSPENHSGSGANVVFLDGSVEWLDTSNFVALTSSPACFFGTTNEEQLAGLQSRTKIIRATKPIEKRQP
jgi:prepilin-type processing-associated H-X9-DG protein